MQELPAAGRFAFPFAVLRLLAWPGVVPARRDEIGFGITRRFIPADLAYGTLKEGV